MTKKKILFHINSLGKGGAERVVSVLSGFFCADNYEVVIVTLWRAEDEYEIPNEVKRINLEDIWQGRKMGRIQKAVSRLWNFREILKEEAPNLVISFCNKANFRCAYAMTGMQTPLLVSVRNDPRIDYFPYKASVRKMEKRASGCVFQTRDAKECFAEEFQKKARVIWNPVDERYFSEGARWCGSGSEHCVVTVGRLSKQKNHLLLLEAFAKIKDKFPEVTLKIYGKESEDGILDKLRSFIRDREMEDRVLFMGEKSRLEREMKAASLFVLSSDYEGMPNALAEAMVMGMPVISTDCPCYGPAELIEDGVSGYLVPVGDAKALAEKMEQVLANRKLAEMLGSHAGIIREKVKPKAIYLEWKRYVDELMG